MAEYKSLGEAKHRKPDLHLRQQHRDRLAKAVWAMRKAGGFMPNQDYRTAKAYAGVPITCDAYLDRVEVAAKIR
jgi:hypothetical protein